MAIVKLDNGGRTIADIDDFEYGALRRAVEFYKRHLTAEASRLNKLATAKMVVDEELILVDLLREQLL